MFRITSNALSGIPARSSFIPGITTGCFETGAEVGDGVGGRGRGTWTFKWCRITRLSVPFSIILLHVFQGHFVMFVNRCKDICVHNVSPSEKTSPQSLIAHVNGEGCSTGFSSGLGRMLLMVGGVGETDESPWILVHSLSIWTSGSAVIPCFPQNETYSWWNTVWGIDNPGSASHCV